MKAIKRETIFTIACVLVTFGQADYVDPCHLAQERNKEELDNDFYTVYNGNDMYSDPKFTPDATSLYWGDQSEWLEAASWGVHWVRASE